MLRSEWRIKRETKSFGPIYKVQSKFLGFLWLTMNRVFYTEWGARNWIEWAESDNKVEYITIKAKEPPR